MAEDLEKNKQEPKVLKKDLETAEESKVCEIEDQEGNKECLDVPIGLKTSCQLEESAKSGIQESTSPSTKRKFGSRRTNMAKRDLGELNPSESENEERHSDDIMIKKAGQTGRSPGQKQAIDLKNRTEQDMEMVQFNVVMVGDSCVGKTSFVRRFHKGYFTPDYSSTIGVDTCVQNVVLDERVVKLHIWDTAGQERFHSITTQVFHRANGLLLMYDITSSKSFMSVRNWITQVQEKAPDDVVMMLLGNKNDSVEREVQVQEGEDLAREYKIHFMECSAATGDNVSECMKSLAELLVQRKRQKVEKHTALKREQPQKKSGCC
nr:ras-related protein Rab-8B [Misgurnus anguillicaudatus]